ncbi:hypothetical protein BESB_016480 [Besnoitia besnoiti]|uniref:Uncharacterized protein n=1 Tax=Besnoitia besnoiti TaxID=94643 RepID=A0A2A9MAD5_BESBE|nr:hypothetical protein BESB_016480 [Besnoitia besnoiti]PFH32330.1 hypothetical protein BESB_016480 [Besnoitia besnoiti]
MADETVALGVFTEWLVSAIEALLYSRLSLSSSPSQSLSPSSSASTSSSSYFADSQVFEPPQVRSSRSPSSSSLASSSCACSSESSDWKTSPSFSPAAFTPSLASPFVPPFGLPWAPRIPSLRSALLTSIPQLLSFPYCPYFSLGIDFLLFLPLSTALSCGLLSSLRPLLSTCTEPSSCQPFSASSSSLSFPTSLPSERSSLERSRKSPSVSRTPPPNVSTGVSLRECGPGEHLDSRIDTGRAAESGSGSGARGFWGTLQDGGGLAHDSCDESSAARVLSRGGGRVGFSEGSERGRESGSAAPGGFSPASAVAGAFGANAGSYGKSTFARRGPRDDAERDNLLQGGAALASSPLSACPATDPALGPADSASFGRHVREQDNAVVCVLLERWSFSYAPLPPGSPPPSWSPAGPASGMYGQPPDVQHRNLSTAMRGMHAFARLLPTYSLLASASALLRPPAETESRASAACDTGPGRLRTAQSFPCRFAGTSQSPTSSSSESLPSVEPRPAAMSLSPRAARDAFSHPFAASCSPRWASPATPASVATASANPPLRCDDTRRVSFEDDSAALSAASQPQWALQASVAFRWADGAFSHRQRGSLLHSSSKSCASPSRRSQGASQSSSNSFAPEISVVTYAACAPGATRRPQALPTEFASWGMLRELRKAPAEDVRSRSTPAAVCPPDPYPYSSFPQNKRVVFSLVPSTTSSSSATRGLSRHDAGGAGRRSRRRVSTAAGSPAPGVPRSAVAWPATSSASSVTSATSSLSAVSSASFPCENTRCGCRTSRSEARSLSLDDAGYAEETGLALPCGKGALTVRVAYREDIAFLLQAAAEAWNSPSFDVAKDAHACTKRSASLAALPTPARVPSSAWSTASPSMGATSGASAASAALERLLFPLSSPHTAPANFAAGFPLASAESLSASTCGGALPAFPSSLTTTASSDRPGDSPAPLPRGPRASWALREGLCPATGWFASPLALTASAPGAPSPPSVTDSASPLDDSRPAAEAQPRDEGGRGVEAAPRDAGHQSASAAYTNKLMPIRQTAADSQREAPGACEARQGDSRAAAEQGLVAKAGSRNAAAPIHAAAIPADGDSRFHSRAPWGRSRKFVEPCEVEREVGPLDDTPARPSGRQRCADALGGLDNDAERRREAAVATACHASPPREFSGIATGSVSGTRGPAANCVELSDRQAQTLEPRPATLGEALDGAEGCQKGGAGAGGDRVRPEVEIPGVSEPQVVRTPKDSSIQGICRDRREDSNTKQPEPLPMSLCAATRSGSRSALPAFSSSSSRRQDACRASDVLCPAPPPAPPSAPSAAPPSATTGGPAATPVHPATTSGALTEAQTRWGLLLERSAALAGDDAYARVPPPNGAVSAASGSAPPPASLWCASSRAAAGLASSAFAASSGFLTGSARTSPGFGRRVAGVDSLPDPPLTSPRLSSGAPAPRQYAVARLPAKLERRQARLLRHQQRGRAGGRAREASADSASSEGSETEEEGGAPTSTKQGRLPPQGGRSALHEEGEALPDGFWDAAREAGRCEPLGARERISAFSSFSSASVVAMFFRSPEPQGTRSPQRLVEASGVSERDPEEQGERRRRPQAPRTLATQADSAAAACRDARRRGEGLSFDPLFFDWTEEEMVYVHSSLASPCRRGGPDSQAGPSAGGQPPLAFSLSTHDTAKARRSGSPRQDAPPDAPNSEASSLQRPRHAEGGRDSGNAADHTEIEDFCGDPAAAFAGGRRPKLIKTFDSSDSDSPDDAQAFASVWLIAELVAPSYRASTRLRPAREEAEAENPRGSRRGHTPRKEATPTADEGSPVLESPVAQVQLRPSSVGVVRASCGASSVAPSSSSLASSWLFHDSLSSQRTPPSCRPSPAFFVSPSMAADSRASAGRPQAAVAPPGWYVEAWQEALTGVHRDELRRHLAGAMSISNAGPDSGARRLEPQAPWAQSLSPYAVAVRASEGALAAFLAEHDGEASFELFLERADREGARAAVPPKGEKGCGHISATCDSDWNSAKIAGGPNDSDRYDILLAAQLARLLRSPIEGPRSGRGRSPRSVSPSASTPSRVSPSPRTCAPAAPRDSREAAPPSSGRCGGGAAPSLRHAEASGTRQSAGAATTLRAARAIAGGSRTGKVKRGTSRDKARLARELKLLETQLNYFVGLERRLLAPGSGLSSF